MNALTRRVLVQERAALGQVRHEARRAASSARLEEIEAAQVGIVATEMATNLLKHTALGGEILINVWPADGKGAVEMIAIDRGPGMTNPAVAFEDGYSTAGSAGSGLGAIRRQSTSFDLHSIRGVGTAVMARVGSRHPFGEAGFELGVVTVPKVGEDVSGDGWAMASADSCTQLFVVDGLGHGLLANDAADRALRAYEKRAATRSVDVLQAVHDVLRGTRGATGAVYTIEASTGELRHAGVGNIGARLVAADGARQLVSMNGTLGRDPVRFKEFQVPWSEDAILVIHSDGLGSRWKLDGTPGLASRDPAIIAAVLFRDHAQQLDDVTVVVARASRRGAHPE